MAAVVLRNGENQHVHAKKPLPSLPMHGIRKMTEVEQHKVASAVNTYITESAKLELLTKQVSYLEAKESALKEKKSSLIADSKASEAKIQAAKAEQQENRRQAVKTILPKNVLGIDPKAMSAFTQEILDKIGCNLTGKKCLSTDEEGMDSVIIPLIKMHHVTNVNLALFKDEITPKALMAFFKALPDTQVTSISLGKPLTAEETTAKQIAEQALAKLGRQLIFTVKAA